MEVHIESYFWNWTAFCTWEILSENRKMSSSSGWLYIDGSNSSYLSGVFTVCCVLYKYSCSSSRLDYELSRLTGLPNLIRWETGQPRWCDKSGSCSQGTPSTRQRRHFYIIISRAFKSIKFPRLVTGRENLIYKENYFLLKPTLKKKDLWPNRYLFIDEHIFTYS